MYKKLEDLRFVIGLFFLILGVILLVASRLYPPLEGINLNQRVGVVMLLFSGAMLYSSTKE
jgi:hypothetical protein